MKKLVSMLTGLAVFASAMIFGVVQARGEEPLARVTSGEIVISATATNGASELWLNTGADKEVNVGGVATKTGAGCVRALMYRVPDGVMTNWSITFYAYDGGVKKSLYSASSATAAPTSGRSDLLSTNLIYSGKLRVEVFHNYAYTNAATHWAWSAIVE